MKMTIYYFVLQFCFISTLTDLVERGKEKIPLNYARESNPKSSIAPIEKEFLVDSNEMDKNEQTMADLITLNLNEKEKPSTESNGKTMAELFNMESIDEIKFNEFLNEIRENEQLIGIVFESHQTGQSNKLEIQQKINEKMIEKLQKLSAIKENDPVMSQIIEKLSIFIKEVKSGNVSNSLKEYLLFAIKICAMREQIPLSQIITNKKFETKLIAKLVKLLLEEKGKNNQQKKEKNDEKTNKSNGKQILGLMHSVVENLNIAANIKYESDNKNKRKRRKKRFYMDIVSIGMLALVLCIILIFACLLGYIMDKIHTWLVNRRLDPISLAKNAWSKFKQYKVTKAINKITEHTVENDGDGGCAICLGAYEIGDKVRTLPCQHQFHSECVDEWIKKHNNCPSCRAQILNVEMFRNARPNNGQQEQSQSSRTMENEQQNLDNTENV